MKHQAIQDYAAGITPRRAPEQDKWALEWININQLQAIAKRNAAPFVDLLALFKTFAYYAGGWKQEGLDQFALYGSCLVGAYMEAPRSLCSNPDQRVFWDEYHPTKHLHEIIARTVQKTAGL